MIIKWYNIKSLINLTAFFTIFRPIRLITFSTHTIKCSKTCWLVVSRIKWKSPHIFSPLKIQAIILMSYFLLSTFLSASIFITPYSFLFLQLHDSIWGTAVSQLPSGVRKQYALCVAYHYQPWEPDQSGFQRPEHGEAVWLPLDQRWGKGTGELQAVAPSYFQ